MTEEDYAAFDRSHRWNYRVDKQAAAERLGYRYISQALAEEYAKGRISTRIADDMGVTKRAVIHRLKQMGIPRRSRGGDNRSKRWQNND